jgi:hypothetical protein
VLSSLWLDWAGKPMSRDGARAKDAAGTIAIALMTLAED